MNFRDIVPANLSSEDVARKAKQERDKEIQLFKVKAALASIWNIKYSQEFNNCIHEIDKFSRFYYGDLLSRFYYRDFIMESHAAFL